VTERSARWRLVFLLTSALFLGLALTVLVVGVFPFERMLHEWVLRVVPAAAVPPSFALTKLGSERFIFLAGLIILAALPLGLLGRWWLWIAVVIAATWLEGVAKDLVGRPRPMSFRPGFPSGHATQAAAFYFLLAYLAGGIFPSRRWRVVAWALAGSTVAVVAATRIVLQAHWPLDTVGGALLGLALVAGAAWWHEEHARVTDEATGPTRTWVAWLERRKDFIPIPFYAVLFLTPPFVDEEALLDHLCDVIGLLIVVAGVLIRMWAVGQLRVPQRRHGSGDSLVTTGPYAYVRHPIYVANALIGIGVALLAENAAALLVIPAVTCVLYRLIVPVEELRLREVFGPAYETYRARVPRWMPNRLPLAGDSSRLWAWTALRQDYRAVLTTTILVVIAEVSESLPHLLR
jgi:protein-S-isoprenylcysteine O-methyltransferase Ste14/membrane-associated phospholipid phosphatase